MSKLPVLMFALACLCTAATASAHAQGPAGAGLVPVESFFGQPDIDKPLLSPSGRHVAVLMAGAGGRNRLAAIDLDKPSESRALAGFADADIVDVRWVDAEWLVFGLRDLQAGGGEDQIAPGLLSVSVRTADPRELVRVNLPWMKSASIGVDKRLDYNHMLLAVPRDGSREVIVGELTFNAQGYADTVVPKRLHVETSRVRNIDIGSIGPVTRWHFDPLGRPRLATLYDKERIKLLWRDKDVWTPLLEGDSLSVPWSPHSVDAAGTLYIEQNFGEAATSALLRYDFAKGQPEEQPLISVPGFDFNGHFVRDPSDGRTLGVRASTDGETTVWIDPALKALQAEIDERLPGRVNRISCRACTGDTRVVLIESWSDRDPGQYLVLRGQPGGLQRIGQHRKAIDPERMARLLFARTRARDGQDLPVWITLPARAQGAAPPPAVVLVHGGPWTRGVEWGWHALPQFLASRAYAVIEPEFRGSTGYGTQHEWAGWRQWGQAMQDDVADALKWAVAQGHVDGKRVCIAGGSYGGYSALMGLVRDGPLYRCGAAWAAVSEPMRMLQGSWWWTDDIGDVARGHDWRARIGDPKTDAAMLKAASPLQQAQQIRAPVLLVHGELDRRVPVVHAREMRDALVRHGQQPEWLSFADEAHGWQRVDNQIAFARRLEGFLDRHLK